jgi:uncharacterized protein YjbJ (UPF0337 family)
MNWDQIAGKWSQVKGDIRQKWGKLTDNDLEVVAGSKDKWSGESKRGTESPKSKPNVSSTSGSQRLGPNKRLNPPNLARDTRAHSSGRNNPVLTRKFRHGWALLRNWQQAKTPEAPFPTRVNA